MIESRGRDKKVLKNKNSVAFDLDGVLSDTAQILREEILNKFKIDIYPIKKYAISLPGISGPEFKQFVKDTLSKYSEDILPYNDTVEYLEKIHLKTETPIRIITARHESLSYETHAWCQKYLTVPYELYFMPSNEKKYLLLYLRARFYIDDHPETILNILKNTSINAILMDRSYNKDCKLPKNSCRVSNLGEFYSMIF